MEKKVFVGPDTIFNNAQCMFVEYYDVIKCPWFALLTCIKDEPSLENIFSETLLLYLPSSTHIDDLLEAGS